MTGIFWAYIKPERRANCPGKGREGIFLPDLVKGTRKRKKVREENRHEKKIKTKGKDGTR
ncbi:MAG: hypothetical protein PUA63_06615 [Oscillospiraceae bacterium]|nr:hypothetical protein [Oscillospiraceae bacterium]